MGGFGLHCRTGSAYCFSLDTGKMADHWTYIHNARNGHDPFFEGFTRRAGNAQGISGRSGATIYSDANCRSTGKQIVRPAFPLCSWINLGCLLSWSCRLLGVKIRKFGIQLFGLLCRGNVALSVLMTAVSTFLAVVMTPLLTAKLAGQYVAVDAGGLFASTLQVVLLPVLAGALMNQYIPSTVSIVSPFTPLVAVVTVSALCASAIAQNASAILSSGGQVVLAVCALHAIGFYCGYLLSRLLGYDVATSRTISIEVGMQNSVLGVVLATQHFSNPLTAVPCAVSSVCQSIFGSAAAGFWRLASNKELKD